MTEQEGESKRFAPKVAVQLDPPKDDPISVEELAKCDGTRRLSLTDHNTRQFLIFNAPSSRIIG